MKVGYRWLLDYVTIPWGPAELADRLTAIGTAVDRMEPVFTRFSGVVVSRILTSEILPQRPELRVLTVDDGSARHTIVSGASNAQAGLIEIHLIASSSDTVIPRSRPAATPLAAS